MTEEALNNGLIGTIDLLVAKSKVYSPPYWLATIEDDGDVVAVAVHTKPDGLVVTDLPVEVAHSLVREIDDAIGPPHRIMAPKHLGEILASSWVKARDVTTDLQMVWNAYVLRGPTARTKKVEGSLRLASEKDKDLARTWGKLYGKEKPAPVDVSEFMLRKLRRQELYVWDNQGVTTLLTLSGFTDTGVRISAVYTPHEHRGKGYASAAVAAAAAMLFENGRSFVTLVAIEDDPAERIYQKLGFERIGSRACYSVSPLLHELN